MNMLVNLAMCTMTIKFIPIAMYDCIIALFEHKEYKSLSRGGSAQGIPFRPSVLCRVQSLNPLHSLFILSIILVWLLICVSK